MEQVANEAGIPTETEELCREEAEIGEVQDRYDLTLRGAGVDGRDVCVDVTVCHPQAASYVEKAATSQLHTARKREKEKKDHYQPLIRERRPPAQFVPAAVEVTGALGFGFRRLIQIVASRQSGSGRVYVPANFNALTYKHLCATGVAVALAKGTAGMLREAMGSTLPRWN